MFYLPSREQPLLDEIAELLGGSLFLSSRFFEHPLPKNPSLEYLKRLKSAIKLAFQIDSSSELEKDGLLPKVLRQEIIKTTRARLQNPRGNQLQNYVNYGDIRRVISSLQEIYDSSRTWGEFFGISHWKFLNLNKDLLSLDLSSFFSSQTYPLSHLLLPILDTEDEKAASSQEEEEQEFEDDQGEEEAGSSSSSSESSGSSEFSEEGTPESEGQDCNRPLRGSNAGVLSETQRDLDSVADRITECWGNDSWKKAKLRKDLEPVSLVNRKCLSPLLKIANLTRCESSVGFPPLALKVLKEALRRDETTGQSKSSKGWAQEKVIKAALVIIEKKSASKKSSISSSNKSSKANQPAIGSSSTSSSSLLRPSFASSSFNQSISSSKREANSFSSPDLIFNELREAARSKSSRNPSRFDEVEVARHLKVFKDFLE